MRKTFNASDLPPVAEDQNSSPYLKAGLSPEAVHFLKAAFNQFDPDKVNMIDFREVINAVFFKGMKFYDKEVYQLLRIYEQKPEGKITFKEFIQLLRYVDLGYNNLKELATLKSDYEYLLSKPKENTLNIHALNIDIEKVGLSEKKLDKLKEGFSKIDQDKDGCVSFDEMSKLVPIMGNNCSTENIKWLFEELDCENDGILSFNELLLGMTTKKGILSIYNFLMLTKMCSVVEGADNQQPHQNNKLIILEDYLSENMTDSTVLDLVEAFQLFDVESVLRIKSSLLKEHEGKVQLILSAEEKKVYDELSKLNCDEVDFDLMFKWVVEGGFSSKDTVTLARKFNEYWTIFEKANRFSFEGENKNDKQEKEHKYLNQFDKLKEKHTKTNQEIYSINVLRPNPISITDIEPTQNIFMAKRRSSSNTAGQFDGGHVQSLQRFSAVFGEGSLEKPGIDSIYQFSLESLAEDEFEIVKNFLTLKRQELSADPNSIFRDEHFVYVENDFLKQENTKLREELASREDEIAKNKQKMIELQNRLQLEVNRKEELAVSMQEELDNKAFQLGTTKEETKKLIGQIADLQDQMQKINQNLDKVQQKLAAKVKDLLLKDDMISDLEIMNKDKAKEIEELQALKTKDDKGLQEINANLKKKLEYVTQKFSEYLTQNTSLQSEVHEKDDKLKKIESAMKQEKEKSQGIINKLEAKLADMQAKYNTSMDTVDIARKQAIQVMAELEMLQQELDEKEDCVQRMKEMDVKLDQNERELEYLRNILMDAQEGNSNSQSLIACIKLRLDTMQNSATLARMVSFGDDQFMQDRIDIRDHNDFELANCGQNLDEYMGKLLNQLEREINPGKGRSYKEDEPEIKHSDQHYINILESLSRKLNTYQEMIMNKKREITTSSTGLSSHLTVDTHKFSFGRSDYAHHNDFNKENPSAISTAMTYLTKPLVNQEEEEAPHTAQTNNESLLSHQDFVENMYKMKGDFESNIKDTKRANLSTEMTEPNIDTEPKMNTDRSEESSQAKFLIIQQDLSNSYEILSDAFIKKTVELEEKLMKLEVLDSKFASITETFKVLKDKNIGLVRELRYMKAICEDQDKLSAQKDREMEDLKAELLINKQGLSNSCEVISDAFAKKTAELEEKLMKLEVLDSKFASITETFKVLKDKNMGLVSELGDIKARGEDQAELSAQKDKQMEDLKHNLSNSYEVISDAFLRKTAELEERLIKLEVLDARFANMLETFKVFKDKNMGLVRELGDIKAICEDQAKLCAQKDKQMEDLRKRKKRQIEKQHKHFDDLLKKLTQEIITLKNGGISDL